MATLHRFKLLATQCATAAVRSPVTSPSASPCPHLAAAVGVAAVGVGGSTTPSKSPSFNLRHHHRRRRTLRRLLTGSSGSSSSSNSSSGRSSGGTRSIFGARHAAAAKGGRPSSMDLAAVPTAPAAEGGRGGDKRALLTHTSLKDLFVSSPSPPPSSSESSSNTTTANLRGGRTEDQHGAAAREWRRIGSPVRGGRGGAWGLGIVEGFSTSSRRFGVSGGSLRYRLLRRAWRPVLLTIPE